MPEALKYLQPLEPRTRGLDVLDALARMVDRAGLNIGDKLPPEVLLARSLGVGRSTMREALNRWEGLGIIRRRRGDGTYLAARVQSFAGPLPHMLQLEGQALLRLLDVRLCLEVEAARKAAQNASTRQRAEIGRLCDDLLDIIARGAPYRDADAAFHRAIGFATGNPMFGQILGRLDEMFERSVESPFSHNAFGLASFPMHRDLSDAIVDGDQDRAAAAITAIIGSVANEVRRIIGETVGPD